MTYRVEAQGQVIGHSKLEEADPSMGVLRGRFHPEPGYEGVRSVFRMFAEANPDTSATPADDAQLARYYRARDSLGLKLFDQSGRPIGTEWIHVYDFTVEAGSDALEVEVAVSDATFWKSRQADRSESDTESWQPSRGARRRPTRG